MLLWINQIFGFPWGITLLYLYPKCGMTAEIWRIRRVARQTITSGSNLIQIGVNTVFSSSAKQPTFFGFKFDFAAPGSNYGFVVFYRKFTKFANEISFFVLVASAVATVRQGAPSPQTTACAPQFWFIQNAFLEHRVTTRQQAIMDKEIIIFKHDSRLKFSRLFAKLLATNCCK